MGMCLCASEKKEDEEFIEFVAHGEEREKKGRTEINKIINTHATVTVHIEKKGRTKINKIINTHATVTVHICTVTVAIVHKCTIMHKLVWAFFCSNCVKLATFSILHNYV